MANVIHAQTGELHYLRLDSTGGEVVAFVRGQRFAVPYAAGDDVNAALAELAAQLGQAGWRLQACANCTWFRQSGASLQQTGGWGGYCTLVTTASVSGLVSAKYGCLQWTTLSSWPAPIEQIQTERMVAWRSHPDRRTNFVGALLGIHRVASKPFVEQVEAAVTIIAAPTSHPDGQTLAPAAFARLLQALPEHAQNPSPFFLAIAIPVSLLYWQDERQSFAVIDQLSHQLAVLETDRLAALAVTKLFALAMAKTPYHSVPGVLQRWVIDHAPALQAIWQPWIDAAQTKSEPANDRGWSLDDDAPTAVAAAWFAWQQAGGLVEPALAQLADRTTAAAIAGGLCGAVHGERNVPPLAETEQAESQRWIELGEHLFAASERGAPAKSP